MEKKERGGRSSILSCEVQICKEGENKPPHPLNIALARLVGMILVQRDQGSTSLFMSSTNCEIDHYPLPTLPSMYLSLSTAFSISLGYSENTIPAHTRLHGKWFPQDSTSFSKNHFSILWISPGIR